MCIIAVITPVNNTSQQKRMLLLGFLALTLGALSVFLFFDVRLGLNYPLFILAVATAGLLLAREFGVRLVRTHYVLIGLGLFFALMVFFRASELLTFFNILGSALLFFTAILLLTGKKITAFLLRDYCAVVVLPFRFIGPFFETMPMLFSRQQRVEGSTVGREYLRGGFVALVLVGLFGVLLSSADQGFAGLIADIFSLSIDPLITGRILLGSFMSAFFVGAFGFIFVRAHNNIQSPIAENKRWFGVRETAIVLSAINMLFFVFILLQASYLFGGTEGLEHMGSTYASYAREGFFQLIAVAVLSYIIIALAEKEVLQQNGAHHPVFTALGGLLVLQVVAILASAFSRLLLYENAYGFTTIRLYSHAFMLWLAILLSLLGLHIWKGRDRGTLSFRIFCSIVIFLGVLNFLNPDQFIAMRNIERYHRMGVIDAEYLGTLSSDALTVSSSLLGDPDARVRERYIDGLVARAYNCDNTNCIIEDGRQSWKSLRFTESSGKENLAHYKEELEAGILRSKNERVLDDTF